MTQIKPIPSIAVVQAVARNGAQHQNFNPQVMRHAFAIRGQELPEEEQENEKELDVNGLGRLLIDVEKQHSQLKFEMNESLGRILVSVIDRDTGELIRQIPGEAAIATAEHLKSIESGNPTVGTFLDSTS